MPVFTPQLNAITQFNPGINLSDADMKLAAAGQLQLVGLGSILPTGPIVANPGSNPNRNPAKGCIQILRYQKNSNDLIYLTIDGNAYSGGNINDFRDILTDASLNGKCINFCWNEEKKEMSMVNVYPQCCCECDEKRD